MYELLDGTYYCRLMDQNVTILGGRFVCPKTVSARTIEGKCTDEGEPLNCSVLKAANREYNKAPSLPKLTSPVREIIKDSAPEVFGRFGSP